jgi:hypothetical protein
MDKGKLEDRIRSWFNSHDVRDDNPNEQALFSYMHDSDPCPQLIDEGALQYIKVNKLNEDDRRNVSNELWKRNGVKEQLALKCEESKNVFVFADLKNESWDHLLFPEDSCLVSTKNANNMPLVPSGCKCNLKYCEFKGAKNICLPKSSNRQEQIKTLEANVLNNPTRFKDAKTGLYKNLSFFACAHCRDEAIYTGCAYNPKTVTTKNDGYKRFSLMRFSEHAQLNKRWVHWLNQMTVKYRQKLQKNLQKHLQSGDDDDDDIIYYDSDASDNGQQMLQEERQKRWEEDTLKSAQASQRRIQNE